MRTVTLLFALLLPACASAENRTVPSPDALDTAWADSGRFGLVHVRIERRLYERAGSPHFFIRVRVSNPTPSAVAVDLRDGWRVFYPNQWGGLPEPQRMTIDERIMEPRALTPALRARLIGDYRANALALIPAGASLDYFRAFNASGRADVDAVRAPYLFVSIKGQLLATDGARVENLLPAVDSLYLRTPVAWATVPDGARVVPD